MITDGKPTLRISDVARHAGVSSATVSRVLNGHRSVRSAKRDQVLAAVEELGYRPNRLASNLRRLQAEMIGVVVSDIENPHFAEMVRAVEDAAYLRGHRVLLCNTDEDPGKQRDYLEVLAAERVAGVILSPTDARAPEIAALLDRGVALVAFDRGVDNPRVDVVVAENVAGLRRGTEHLIDCGHVRIGFVGGPAGVETADERLVGYAEAMAAAGLAVRVADGGFREDGGRRAAGQLVEEGATALLVANNLMTIGALQALRQRGLAVPGDVALVSVDDPPWAELIDPPLTTLAQPVREMAATAVDLLLERIDPDRPHRRRRRHAFDLELRHRGSCCGERR